MGRRHDPGVSTYQHASGYFTGTSIIIDKRRSGYPCWADITCRFISTEIPPRNAHEAAIHQFLYVPPPPPSPLGARFGKATRRAPGAAS